MPYDYPSPKQTGGDPFTREVYVTTNGSTKRKKGPGNKSPLAALLPVAVLTPAEHAIDIVLGADSVSRDQRDAALAYLNEALGSGSTSFKMQDSAPGKPYVLHGTTDYTGSAEFRELCLKVVQPEFPFVGTLTMTAARAVDRKLRGVECVVTAVSRSSLLRLTLPTLDATPEGALAMEHEGNAVAFTVREPDRDDEELIKDALRVAAAFGVYIERPPTEVKDEDRRARLYPELRHSAPTG